MRIIVRNFILKDKLCRKRVQLGRVFIEGDATHSRVYVLGVFVIVYMVL